MPLIKPLARYFSIPSRDVGGLHLRNVALNCSPCSLSCTQLPRALIHSPALTLARAPTTVTNSRWPFTFTRSTANPVSSLWKVMRSINPENPSCGGDAEGAKFPDTCGGWVASLIPIFILQPPFEGKNKRQFGYSRDKRPGYCVSGHLTDPHP